MFATAVVHGMPRAPRSVSSASASDRGERRSASPDKEGLKFSDLVRAREVQQERLRLLLEEQNAMLREKLQKNDEERSASQSRSESQAPVQPAGGASPAPTAPAPTGRRTPPPATIAPAAAPPVPVIDETKLEAAIAAATENQHVELHAVIDTLRDIVKQGMSAQHAAMEQFQQHQYRALEQLSDRVDTKLAGMQKAIDDLHTVVLQDEATRSILREEQLAQYMEMCKEVDNVRDEIGAQMRRMEARDDTVASLRTALNDNIDAVGSMEQRVAGVEEIPSAIRGDMDALTERFQALSAGVTAERASLQASRNEVLARQEDEVATVLREAKEQLTKLVAAAADCEGQAASVNERMATQIQEAVAKVAEQLEVEIVQRQEEQTERVQQMQQRQAMEHQTMTADIQQSLAEVRQTVDSSLMGMRRQYHDAVQEQLRAVVQQAEEFEAQRRAECPVADSDRIELMVSELQGASTMIEGIMKNAVATQRHDPHIPARVEAMEVRLASIEARVTQQADNEETKSAALQLRFTVPVQTAGEMNIAASPEERASQRAAQNLQDELDKAADEVRQATARKVLSRASPRFADPTPRGSVPMESPKEQSQSVASTARSSREAKERQLAKLQGILRSIQQTFHMLTAQESEEGGSWSAAKLEEVARQKQEMYHRERQLVEQRNHLWREISELQAREEGSGR